MPKELIASEEAGKAEAHAKARDAPARRDFFRGFSPQMQPGRMSSLLKHMGPAAGAALGGKAGLLREIQRSYGNAFAQQVVLGFQGLPGAKAPTPSFSPPKGPSGKAPPPPPENDLFRDPTDEGPRLVSAIPSRPGAALFVVATQAPTPSDKATAPPPDKAPVPADRGVGDSPGAQGAKPAPTPGADSATADAKGGTAGGHKGKGAEGKEKKPAHQDAGGGPIAGAGGDGGGGRGGGGGGGAPAPRSPDQDPAFQEVKGRAGAAARRQKSHEPAKAKSAQAQAAAVGPPDEVPSKASARQAGVMGEQKAKPFDRAAFKAALLKKIEQITPKNLEEADDFKDNGKAGELKGEVAGKVGEAKEASQGDIEKENKAEAKTDGIDKKPETPLAPNPPGPCPRDLGAAKAAPKSKADSEISMKESSKKLDNQWKETGLEDKDVDASNEPKFQKAKSERDKGKADSEQKPKDYRKSEVEMLAKAEKQADGTADKSTVAMHAARGESFAAVTRGQRETKSRDELKREEIAGHIQSIFNTTRDKVTKRLADLDKVVGETFDQGAEAARAEFEKYVDERMRAYKRRRYGGWFGGAKWLKDKIFGMPNEVNVFYTEGRDLYLRRMDETIDKVSENVETGLNEAMGLIAQGRTEVDEYVASLDPSLREIGGEEAERVQDQFSELEQSVTDKQDQLIDSLAQKYKENLEKLDARIEELKAANRGLVDAIIALIKEIIAIIKKLVNAILNLLARIASIMGKIIRHPIRFLTTLVSAVKGGILGFKERIGEHLQAGLLAWLLGPLGEAGIQMPASLDFKGIVFLVLQVLGLTYANIRSRAVKIVGERVVQTLETGAEIFKILVTEGPAGLWKHIEEQVGDIKTTIIEGIKNFVITKIVVAGITWLISLLNPVSAFIKACKAIIDIAIFFIQRAAQIAALVNAILDSLAAIASGSVAAASALVEKALAKAIPVVIGFLAAFLGLGGIGEKIKSIMEKIRKPINKAIDFLINKAVGAVKSVISKGKAAVKKLRDWWAARRELTTKDGVRHVIKFSGGGPGAGLIIESTPQPYTAYLAQLQTTFKLTPDQVGPAMNKAKEIEREKQKTVADDQKEAQAAAIELLVNQLADLTAALPLPPSAANTPAVYGPLQHGYATLARVTHLHSPHDAGSEPSVSDTAGYEDINMRKSGGGSYYVKGHLLNHNLIGPGNTWSNLTPITRTANSQHESQFESFVKDAVNGPGGKPTNPPGDANAFSVKAQYGRNPNEALITRLEETDDDVAGLDPATNRGDLAAVLRAEASVPTELACSAQITEQQGGAAKTRTVSATIANDISYGKLGQYSLDPSKAKRYVLADNINFKAATPEAAVAKLLELNQVGMARALRIFNAFNASGRIRDYAAQIGIGKKALEKANPTKSISSGVKP